MSKKLEPSNCWVMESTVAGGEVGGEFVGVGRRRASPLTAGAGAESCLTSCSAMKPALCQREVGSFLSPRRCSSSVFSSRVVRTAERTRSAASIRAKSSDSERLLSFLSAAGLVSFGESVVVDVDGVEAIVSEQF